MFEKLLLGKLSTRMKIYQHCDLHMIVPLGFMLYRDFTVINLNLFPFVIVIKHLLGSKVICNLVCSSEPYVNYSVSRRCKIKSLRIMKTRTNESSLGIRQFFLWNVMLYTERCFLVDTGNIHFWKQLTRFCDLGSRVWGLGSGVDHTMIKMWERGVRSEEWGFVCSWRKGYDDDVSNTSYAKLSFHVIQDESSIGVPINWQRGFRAEKDS